MLTYEIHDGEQELLIEAMCQGEALREFLHIRYVLTNLNIGKYLQTKNVAEMRSFRERADANQLFRFFEFIYKNGTIDCRMMPTN